MVRAGFLAATFAFLALTATAQAEQRTPGGGGIILKPLGPPRLVPEPQAPSPYAMTYTEQVAQRLGVSERGVDLMAGQDRANPYAPSVSFNGSMLRLRWQP